MKKIVVLLICVLIIGYIILQNGSSWILKILALESGTSSNVIARPNTSNIQPPYKDGLYTGEVFDAYYGNVQVQVLIQNQKITNVKFLEHPGDRTRSIAINTLAMPILSQEAITSQNANVDIVSGATDTSNAFASSLASALVKAK